MTAPSATELPTAQPNVPANSRHPGPRAVPSVSSVLILPTGPIVDRHRRPQERLQAARRPPAYPNQARIIAPVTPSHPSAVLTPSTCMNRWIRAKGREGICLNCDFCDYRMDRIADEWWVRCPAPGPAGFWPRVGGGAREDPSPARLCRRRRRRPGRAETP